MANLRQAAQANMKGYAPVQSTPQATLQRPALQHPGVTPGRNPTMLASMPVTASTADAFTRQFYGGTNVPTSRTLPAGKGGQ